ncbi:uncharacterized protein LOC116340788 [Contarinia nasturtii]|uniref:uncharacterized protein LOC116340788 n=1 Tax=Contarinia nasturtii TaxID=265458 RepID=UPI0012D3DE90|nr:uncharacterized protein LOC116340788 [Contarinia nasturtii]
MDVYNMYVGDCASTYRNNMFRDYEKHPYGTFEGNGQQPQQQRKSYYTMVQEKLQRAREMAKPKKGSCPFCKEEKKRPLNVYMRKRSQEKNTGKICEEDDEEDQSKCCSGSHDEPSTSK